MLDFQFLKKVNKRYSSLNYNKSLNYTSKNLYEHIKNNKKWK